VAGFDDVIQSALPYLASETISATAGTSWWWGYLITDDAGTLVDLSSGFTFDASIRTQAGTEVAVPTVTTPTTGAVQCKVTPAVSAAITAGAYYHEVTIARTSDAAKIIIVGAGDARLIVKAKVD
jgi:hypothetical protein